MRVYEGSREFGDPAIIGRISAALNIADALIGKLVTATDDDLRQSLYIALTLSPFKARWWIMHNPPNFQGHGHTGLTQQPPARCENRD